MYYINPCYTDQLVKALEKYFPELNTDQADRTVKAYQGTGKVLLSDDGWAMTKGRYEMMTDDTKNDGINMYGRLRIRNMDNIIKNTCDLRHVYCLWVLIDMLPDSLEFVMTNKPYNLTFLSRNRLFQVIYIPADQEDKKIAMLQSLPSDYFEAVKESVIRVALMENPSHFWKIPQGIGFKYICGLDDTKDSRYSIVEDRADAWLLKPRTEEENYEVKKLFGHIDEKYCNSKNARKLIGNIDRTLENYGDDVKLSDYQYSDLTDVLYNSELLSLYIRKMMSERNNEGLELMCGEETGNIERQSDLTAEVSENPGVRNSPVSFEFDGELLKVKVPLTFKRAYGKLNYISNYLLSIYLESAMNDWCNQHKLDLYRTIQAPYVLVMKRLQNKFAIKNICDADNLENQKIINTITRGLGIPDNAQYLSLYSMFDLTVQGEEEGTEFYLFSEKLLDKYAYLLRKRNSEKQSATVHRDITSLL